MIKLKYNLFNNIRQGEPINFSYYFLNMNIFLWKTLIFRQNEDSYEMKWMSFFFFENRKIFYCILNLNVTIKLNLENK